MYSPLLPYRLIVVQENIGLGTLMLQLHTIPFTANITKHSKIYAVKYHFSKIYSTKTICIANKQSQTRITCVANIAKHTNLVEHTNLAIKTKIQKSEKAKITCIAI